MAVRARDAHATSYVDVRPMRHDDLPAVVAIENESYAVPWTEATFRGMLRRRDADLLAAEVDGRLVGYAAQWTVADQGELGNIAVATDWRGMGIGRSLLSSVIECARLRGVRELFLEVRPSNTVAHRLYERFGFRRAGRRRNYYSSPREDALVLRLTIDPDERASPQ